MSKRPLVRPSRTSAVRIATACRGTLVALAVLGGVGACAQEPKVGALRVTYLLQDSGGDAVSCEAAGVAVVRLRLYVNREDAAPDFEVSAPCAADEAGEGQASGEHPVGFFDSAGVALLGPGGEVVVMANGAPAQWEYLTVELTGGGVTDLLPMVTAVLDASAVN